MRSMKTLAAAERPDPYPEFALADQPLPAMLTAPTVPPEYLFDFAFLDSLATDFRGIDRAKHDASAHHAFRAFLADRAERDDPAPVGLS